ncbi:MAG: proton-conducting transporter membrane subunit [Anaeromicrobium sp.]|jgi:formate hydrogenlyase subunit 3/multisubunit Na+/H+ antiporter MnhD subunit|uniref:complex I subunit 5 family protein n=1 Tax=Anaeromicrobium sp. TaxID=1929132 RepID=UPI0025EFEF3A|nr:proton-conducting transporter membrane subunit [Anaeromicrobium sp.]MCT4596241.1 proton-conducting transporter membrane subunit [Anaeromicrobium sp.]
MTNIMILGLIILPAIGAGVGFLIGMKSEKYRDLFNVMITAFTLLLITSMYRQVLSSDIKVIIPDIMGTGLELKLDSFRYIFVWVTSFIWFLCTLYSTGYLIRYKNRNRYYAFFMLTLSSTIGIFLSNNILNLFTFFEIMSFTSYALIIHDQDKYSLDAGKSYLSMAIGAGLVLLMGIFLLFDYTETLNIEEIPHKLHMLGNLKYIISTLILIGFGAKASVYPLHIWLPKAHPAAPTPASAILSGILIKTGIFGMIITVNMLMESDFALSIIMLGFGAINMFFGGFMALFQRNIKRILAYSSMSQAGYILLGMGLIGILEEKGLAVYATLYHIFNHALFKVLLFMGAGIIYMVLHELSINKIRGFGRHKKIVKGMFLIGLLAITGTPGFNGFISKTLLHEALAEGAHLYHNGYFMLLEIIFYMSSAFTVAYLLKIFVFVFMKENPEFYGQYKEHVKKRSLIPMIVLGVTIMYIGFNPQVLEPLLKRSLSTFNIEESIHLHIYTFHNIKGSLISTIIGLIIYFAYVNRVLLKDKSYVNPTLGWINLEENIYKPVIFTTFKASSFLFHIIDKMVVSSVYLVADGMKAISEIDIDISKKRNIRVKNIISPQRVMEEMEDYKYSVSQVMGKINFRVNSLMYSVVIFAIVFATVLALMIN